MYARELQYSACFPPLSALFLAANSAFSFLISPEWPGCSSSELHLQNAATNIFQLLLVPIAVPIFQSPSRVKKYNLSWHPLVMYSIVGIQFRGS